MGLELFEKYRTAGEQYAAMADKPDAAPQSMVMARQAMTEARLAFRAHTDGDT